MDHIHTNDLRDLANALPLLIGSRPIVRIDGHSGVGKTTLAKMLSAKLKLPRVELDNILHFDGRTNYQHPLARKRTLQTLKGFSNRAVIDGICLNAILAINELGPEFRIFMTREYGRHIGEVEKARRRKLGTDQYVLAHQPDLTADLIVVNTWSIR